MAGVPVDGGLDDTSVGGVDVVLVQSHGVKQGIFGLDRAAPKGGRVDSPDSGQGAVRAGVDVRLDVRKALLLCSRTAGSEKCDDYNSEGGKTNNPNRFHFIYKKFDEQI